MKSDIIIQTSANKFTASIVSKMWSILYTNKLNNLQANIPFMCDKLNSTFSRFYKKIENELTASVLSENKTIFIHKNISLNNNLIKNMMRE